jgi:branched-chain amino acid transport system ATP-binding protein
VALLQVIKLTKYFGGLTAVDRLDFNVEEGEILGLIGPNGAGKSTIFNLICGVYRANRGNVIWKGKNITNYSPHRIAAFGIVRVFQQNALFYDFSVLDNLLVGFHLHSKRSVLGSIFYSAALKAQEVILKRKAMEILKFVELEGFNSEFARSLPYGHQRNLGIGIALAAEPKLLLLDEPATGMNAEETSTMMNIINRIREKGCSILLVEHDIRMVMGQCDRIVVVNFGKKIAEGSPVEVQNNKEVIEAYLGVEEDVVLS